MTSSLVSPPPVAELEKPWRASPLTKLFAFTPLWVLLYATFGVQTYFGSSPERTLEAVLSSPGTIVDGFAMLWMLVGVYVLWRARSIMTAALVYLVFTFPATMIVFFGPAVVLILQNMP